LVIAKIAESEQKDNIITAVEVATAKNAVGVVDLISQLPSIVTAEINIEKARREIGATANFAAESDTVKLGASFLA
jgi:hypothetical protein